MRACCLLADPGSSSRINTEILRIPTAEGCSSYSLCSETEGGTRRLKEALPGLESCQKLGQSTIPRPSRTFANSKAKAESADAVINTLPPGLAGSLAVGIRPVKLCACTLGKYDGYHRTPSFRVGALNTMTVQMIDLEPPKTKGHLSTKWARISLSNLPAKSRDFSRDSTLLWLLEASLHRHFAHHLSPEITPCCYATNVVTRASLAVAICSRF